MKDAKGHGSNPRGAHAAGVDTIGRASAQNGWSGAEPIWYHGSPTGEPGNGPVHVGTPEAAKEALEARIGIPADGRGWDGSREYGKTLLAGRDTLAKLAQAGYHSGFPQTGYNTGPAGRLPKQDYYPSQRGDRATFGDGSPVPDSARPAVHSYEITGKMSNRPWTPYADERANGMAGRLKRQGVFYKNIGEDEGSISAIVPGKTHLRRIG